MRRPHAFTLVELLVSLSILVILVLLISQLFVSANIITTRGNKHMDADAQMRPLFERIDVDLAQMVKRSDLDFFGKGTAAPNSSGGAMNGNDQIAFYSAVPGYAPSSTSPGPISLVSYRINSTTSSSNFNKLERMAKALIWNGNSDTSIDCNGTSVPSTPAVFLPITLSATWPSATNATCDPDYELIGRYVFRFEYYYILKNGLSSVVPWDTATHTSVSGLQDIAAISVCIAVIDSKSRILVQENDLTTLAGTMNDYTSSMNPGDLVTQWQRALTSASNIPVASRSSIRFYERYFALAPKR